MAEKKKPISEESKMPPMPPPQGTADSESGVAPDEPRGRQGNAPLCPYCSKKDDKGQVIEPVLCKSARSDPFFTRYYCPNGCGYSEKVPRPQLAQRVERVRAAEEDFSAR
jgi:hypothetical protein